MSHPRASLEGKECNKEQLLLSKAANSFHYGKDTHIQALLADLNDPHANDDPVEVDTARIKAFHKQELVDDGHCKCNLFVRPE